MKPIKIPDDGCFSQITQFLACWESESKATQVIIQAIPETLLHQEIFPEYRTLARLAWHIIQSPSEMLGHTGLTANGPDYDSMPPERLEPILAKWDEVWHSTQEQVSKHWQDESLMIVDKMYGEKWSRSKTLTALVHHMIHHRAQMTVLLRVCGVPVPGTYGPAKEEWAAYGMPIPKV